MNISGPTPITLLNRPDEAALALRLNQRLMAEVLQVSGDRVTLALEGVRVVAQLTSPDQSVALQERRFAQFVVRDPNGPLVTLQYLPPGHAPPEGSALPELIPQVLQFAGLPVNDANVLAARALLGRGLPVTPDLVSELLAALNAIENAGEAAAQLADAQLAAALKSAGLPLTPAALLLARQSFPPLAEMAASLQAQIAAFFHKRAGTPAAETARQALAALEALAVNVDDPQALTQALQRAVSVLGRSLENELAELAKGQAQKTALPQSSIREEGLLALGRLRGELAREGVASLATPLAAQLVGELDRFLEAVRARQLPNVPLENGAGREQWMQFDIPFGAWATATAPPRAGLQSAQIFIAAHDDGEGRKVDAAQTRLVIVVDLADQGQIQVDISVAGERVGARVTASSEGLRQRADAELPSLEDGLARLGYNVQSLVCQTGQAQPPLSFGAPPIGSSNNEVSVQA